MQVSHSGEAGGESLMVTVYRAHTATCAPRKKLRNTLMILLTLLQVVISLSRYQHSLYLWSTDNPWSNNFRIFWLTHRMFCQAMQGSFLFLFKSPAPLLNTIVSFWHFRVNVSIVLPPPNDADLSNKAVNTKYLSSRKIFQDTKITLEGRQQWAAS